MAHVSALCLTDVGIGSWVLVTPYPAIQLCRFPVRHPYYGVRICVARLADGLKYYLCHLNEGYVCAVLWQRVKTKYVSLFCSG